MQVKAIFSREASNFHAFPIKRMKHRCTNLSSQCLSSYKFTYFCTEVQSDLWQSAMQQRRSQVYETLYPSPSLVRPVPSRNTLPLARSHPCADIKERAVEEKTRELQQRTPRDRLLECCAQDHDQPASKVFKQQVAVHRLKKPDPAHSLCMLATSPSCLPLLGHYPVGSVVLQFLMVQFLCLEFY
mmetsp:Transcript_2001/g.12757  ORF Transcript_2001/g.12757 Transcript_2001/m.12757 type:complete len:185 (+) Transcript_2001:1114-1668(+)